MNQVIYILLAIVALILLLPVTTEKRIVEEGGEVIVGGGPKWVELSIEGFSPVRAGSITVYFKPGQERLAQEVAQALQETFQLCLARLGITPSPLSVALFQREDFEDFGSLSFRVKGRWWPLFVSRSWQSLQESDSDFQDSLYWTMLHEAVEPTIVIPLYHDWRARWIGDGLATYAGYIVTKERSPAVANRRLSIYKQQVIQLVEAGRTTYDLIRYFPVMSQEGVREAKPHDPQLQLAGYGIALVFWLDIAQRYGEKVIRKFWERLSAQKPWCIMLGLLCFNDPNAQEAARILSELTGEDIWAKLQKMDLQAVLRTLEQAAGP